MPGTTTTQLTRSSNACDACRSRKVKCSGSRPCTACVRRGLECEFGFVGRRGYSEAYVQRLLEKIKSHEDQLDQLGHGSHGASVSHASSSSQMDDSSPQKQSTHDDTEITDMADLPEDPKIQRPPSPVTELAAGPVFESRVRTIIREHAGTHSQDTSPSSCLTFHDNIESTDGGSWRDAAELVNVGTAPPLLSKDESFRLFDIFVSWMGTHQHFLDPRSFADSIDLLYQSEGTRQTRTQTMWFNQYLLVMAVGMLIGCPNENSDNPPGNTYFAEAMRRLPPIHELGSHGIIAVEILCLASLYLQWCERRHDAYLYIGSAVRLALALGCALPFDEQQGVSSERCHRTRVWWTAYVHDRRLSAALGLPTGAEEQHIRADLPKPARGFENPLPLIINVKIARATSEIMGSFYGNATISQTKLVKRMQTTLQSLYETERSIPSQFSIDFDAPKLSVTRTSASLHLMVFQAIILCIRPFILQRVKDRIQSSRENRPAPAKSPPMTRLCVSCRQAAIKSIRILSALRQDKNNALFGYFDLDATFSAAFILIMKGFLESEDLQKPPEGLSPAADVLRHLANSGNRTAQKRLDELKQFCYNVWSPDNMSQEWGWLKDSAPPSAPRSVATHTSNPGMDPGTTGSGTTESSTLLSGQGHDVPVTGMNPLESWETGWQDSTASEYINLDDFQLDLSMEMGSIYSCYNDPSLPLTGIDEVDWQEVGKMFSMNEV